MNYYHYLVLFYYCKFISANICCKFKYAKYSVQENEQDEEQDEEQEEEQEEEEQDEEQEEQEEQDEEQEQGVVPEVEAVGALAAPPADARSGPSPDDPVAKEKHLVKEFGDS